MTAKTTMLLNLDLATKEVHSDETIRAQLDEKDREARSVRATMFGAPTSPTGSHSDWTAAADAVFRVAHEVEKARAPNNDTPRVIVTGRAGLPLFVQLGAEVSGRVLDFSLLNQRQGSAQWDRLDFTPSKGREDGGNPFFAVREFRAGAEPTGTVAVTVSTNAPRATTEAKAYLTRKGKPLAGEVEIRTHRGGDDSKSVTYLDRTNAAAAASELLEIFNSFTNHFPDAKELAVFVDGPATLAFLVGRAIVLRRSLARVHVPSFHDGAYHDALQLPHRPNVDVFVVHDAKDKPFRERLDKAFVGARARFWDPSLVTPGDVLDAATRRRLDSADLVVVLISADLGANTAAQELIERARARRDAVRTRIVPVLVRECNWTEAIPALRDLQALPGGGKWLKSPRNDGLWMEVDVALRRIVKEIRADLFGEEM